MALGKTSSGRKTRILTQSASVEVRFDVTVDPTPYEKRESARSLLGAVADGKVVVSVIVNGVESSTKRSGQIIKRGKDAKTWLVRIFQGRDENGKRNYFGKVVSRHQEGCKQVSDQYAA